MRHLSFSSLWSRLGFVCSPWRSLHAPIRGVLLAGALLAVTPIAHADDQSVPLKAQARALFEDAKTLVAQSRHAEACPKFQESQRLDPGIGTKFYLADCLEHVGRFASAWVLYMEVADETAEAKMKEREEYAKKRAESLKPKLTRMVIVLADDVKSIPGIEVRRDGVVVAAGLWGTPVPVDAGKHTVVVGAPGKRSWETTVEATGEGAVVSVTIPTLNDDIPKPDSSASATATGVATTVPSTTTTSSAAPVPTDTGWSTQRKLALATGAVGVAGLVIGGVMGGLAAGKKGELDGHCTGTDTVRCDAAGIGIAGDLKTFGTVSTIGIIAGGVLAAGGVVLWLTAPASDSPNVPSTGSAQRPFTSASRRPNTPAPSIGVTPGGFVIRGAF